MVPQRRDDALENWDLFVLRHQNLKNVAVHLMSFFMFWTGPILGSWLHPLYWTLFFASGLVGTAGHYFFQDGTVDAREATSSLQVVMFSSYMAALFMTGQYPKEIKRVRNKWNRFREGLIPNEADPALFNKLSKGVFS